MRLRVALLVVGAVLGLWTGSVVAASAGLSFANRTAWGMVFFMAVGWFAMAVAAVVLAERRRSALLLYAIAMWWFLSELASPAAGVTLGFTVGLVVTAAGPALVAHLGLSHPTGRLRRWPDAIVVTCGYAVLVGVLGLVGTSVFDPESMGCANCPGNLLLINADSSLLDRVNLFGVRLGALWLLVALGALAWRFISAGPAVGGSVGPIALGASIFLGASAAQYLTSLSAGALGSGGPALVVWQLQGASVLLLAAVMCVDMWRARRARRDLTRLVVELRGTSPGGLRGALAERFHDPDLLIGYPIEGGRRHLDAEAQDVSVTPTINKSVTPLVRGGVELATLVHRPGILGPSQQVSDLVVSVQLALESERLAAEALSQLVEIRSSGARIVAAGDAERRRIERDLHDGAQQRLVALLLTLRLIPGHGGLQALAGAEVELRRTISDLRQLAHGVYPVLLKDAGLRAALDSLAETRRLRVEIDADERYPDVVESTVYLLVARLSDAGPTSVRLGRDGSSLRLESSVAGQAESAVDLDDRIHTLGGRLDLTMGEGITHATLVLPVGGDGDLHRAWSPTPRNAEAN